MVDEELSEGALHSLFKDASASSRSVGSGRLAGWPRSFSSEQDDACRGGATATRRVVIGEECVESASGSDASFRREKKKDRRSADGGV